MRPEELAARSSAVAAENDRTVLAALAATGDHGMRPGAELDELVGLPPRTVRNALARLTGVGLVRRDGKRRVWATVAGRAEVGAGTPGLSLVPALDAALECLPAEALRAFARLQLAAVPARWHLADTYAAEWVGFIAGGQTKSCKTSVGRLVCRAYGLDELLAILILRYETPGSILGRRLADSKSPTGFRLERSPVLDLSYLCLDELDKASREVKAAAGALLLGTTQAQLEGAVRTIRPLIYTTLNSDHEMRELDDAYVRRSVVINTGPLRELLADADLGMARLFDASGRIPRLSLERLKPPQSSLPPDLWDLLRGELRAGLTDEGRALSDTEPLARIALGRAALTGGDLEQAVLAVAFDALCCASTLGHTVAGYIDRLAHRLGGGALAPDPNAAEDQRQLLAARRRKRALEKAVNHDRLIEERGRLDQMLDEVIARLDLRRLRNCPADQRVAARGLAARLRQVRADVTAARTSQALAAAEDRCRDPMRRAGELLREIDQEHETRREIQARAAPLQRSRKPELEPARKAMHLLMAMLPNAHGPQLETIERRAQQLEVAPPPVSDQERRRSIAALQAKEINIAWQLNRHLAGPG
jgi:DNA-binding transcriptional ArsR family regulator